MFSFISPQAMHFGRGQARNALHLAAGFGKNVLVVHGATATRAAWLVGGLQDTGLTVTAIPCAAEPTLAAIEQALASLGEIDVDVVVALGGGSVIDFAKALAALKPCKGPAITYLEIVGDGRGLDQAPIPVIALPTTAGTGAEVTKNAVIAVSDRAIKVSLRDPRMVPQVAIVDPDLMQGAPRRVVLAAGMDAITQVIEPYLCNKPNPMTDALCRAAIEKGLSALRPLVEQDQPAAWDIFAWVSTCGGLALANAGLGAVHGLAGVIGGRTGAPHGEICGALLPAVLQGHLRMAAAPSALHDRLTWVAGQIDAAFGSASGRDGIAGLQDWSRAMGLRNLVQMGLMADDYPDVAAKAAQASSMKGNPFVLTQQGLTALLVAAE